jgi:1-phosphatidylinositol-3-phosphate 5-kinase
MDLQQEFEDDCSIPLVDGTSTASTIIGLDSLTIPTLPTNRRNAKGTTDTKQRLGELQKEPIVGRESMSKPGILLNVNDNRQIQPACPKEGLGDAWLKATFSESVEANLRRRLLGSSSIAAPMSVMSATSSNKESTAELVYTRCHLSSTAAQHLSAIVNSLVRADVSSSCKIPCSQLHELWSTIILKLVDKVCTTVSPAICAGDHMDIRPYVKLKTIPGGSVNECCYIDGVVFRKHVVHKRMARTCRNPRILLMSGGIEFLRTCSRLASFGTLMEQEQRYTQIMVEKIVRLRPDLLLVGQSVSRQAQEYLHQHEVVVIQNVKQNLMRRIARMTGAVILSSTDHVNNMGQLGCASIGHCQCFQMVAYLNYLLDGNDNTDNTKKREHLQSQKSDMISGQHRKRIRGHGYTNYVYLAGCPEALGCTLILRGAQKTTLKQVKCIVRFAIYVAYHLRLETSYLLDCGATLFPITDCSNSDLLSTSLAVRFKNTAQHNKLSNFPCLGLPLTTARDHQSLLVTSVWMNQRIQCASAEVKAILFYTPQDVCLGQFLLDSCFNLDLKFPHSDRRSVLDITQIFNHNDGRLTITVVKLDQSLPADSQLRNQDCTPTNQMFDRPILMWSYCRKCERVVTPLVPMSDDTWKMSFGKFLEVSFYNKSAVGRSADCKHRIQSEHINFFGCGNLAARIEYDNIHLYSIHVRKDLPFDRIFHARKLQEQYSQLRGLNQRFSHEFSEKIHELQTLLDVAAKAEADSLNSLVFVTSETSSTFAVAVTAELNQISLEIHQHSSKLEKQLAEALHSGEKITSQGPGPIPDSMHFPGHFHRQLYIHATNWNAQLSLLGRLLTSILESYHHSAVTPGEAATNTRVDLVTAEIQRLQLIKQALHKTTNRTDAREMDDDELEEGIVDENYERITFHEESESSIEAMNSLSSNNTEHKKSRITAPETKKTANQYNTEDESRPVITSSLLDLMPSVPKAMPLQDQFAQRLPIEGGFRRERTGGTASSRRAYKLSSAFARFMGKESPEEDPWIVNLCELEGGRPCLDMDGRGEVLLVHEGQPTTIIAYSLNTSEYTRALQSYLNSDRFPASFMCNRSAATACGSSNNASPICPVPKNIVYTDHTVAVGKSMHTSTRSVDPTDATYLPWAGGLALLISPTETLPAHYSNAGLNRSINSNFGTDHSGLMHTAAPENNNPNRTATSEMCANNRLGIEDTCEEKHIKGSAQINLEPLGDLERQLLSQQKTHVKHRFADVDGQGNTLCKFVCQAYWATQFAAVRQAYIGLGEAEELGYLRSLSMARPWNAQGGKSGATFFKTADGRFVVKQITRTELQMFLEYAPAYFEYLSKSFFHKYDTLLVKVLGVYQIGSHNRVNGRRIMEQVVVMENLFHERTISCAFDLKGSTRSRYARISGPAETTKPQEANEEFNRNISCKAHPVLLDENFMEFTSGRPLPLRDQAKAYFNSAVLNDTLFLSLINVVDYSILVGMDEENHELVVGIIDYMRQYDIIKKMERMGKSVGMIAGQAEPTVIQPPNYRNRFQAAMERYFMMVPDKWTSFRMQTQKADADSPACPAPQSTVTVGSSV